MHGFLKFIFILIIIVYILKLLFRYVLPFLLSRYLKRKMNDFGGKTWEFNNPYQSKNEGDITIDKNTTSKKQYSKNSGEYIDFEEIKD